MCLFISSPQHFYTVHAHWIIGSECVGKVQMKVMWWSIEDRRLWKTSTICLHLIIPIWIACIMKKQFLLIKQTLVLKASKMICKQIFIVPHCKPNLDNEIQNISLNLLIASIPRRFLLSLCDSTQDTPFCSHYTGDLSSEQLYFLGVGFIPLLFPLGCGRDEELFRIFMYHSTFWSCRKIERTYTHPRTHTTLSNTHKTYTKCTHSHFSSSVVHLSGMSVESSLIGTWVGLQQSVSCEWQRDESREKVSLFALHTNAFSKQQGRKSFFTQKV